MDGGNHGGQKNPESVLYSQNQEAKSEEGSNEWESYDDPEEVKDNHEVRPNSNDGTDKEEHAPPSTKGDGEHSPEAPMQNSGPWS